MKLTIRDDENRKTVVPLLRPEISIGRQDGNTIRLTERNVSRRHARLFKEGDSVFVEDLGSHTGVRINGDRIEGRARLQEGDDLEIGDYVLNIEGRPSQDDADTNPTFGVPASARLSSPAPDAASSGEERGLAAGSVRPTEGPKGGLFAGRPLARYDSPRLVCLSGALRGEEFVLRRSVTRFGRDGDDNDVQIDHQSVSRTHGRFEFEQGTWRIFDQKSANGIRVNGRSFGESPVRPGDVIEVGHVKLRFCAPGEEFRLPAEVAETQASSAGKQSRRWMPFFALALVLGAAGAAFYLYAEWRTDKGSLAALCTKGRAALGQKDWEAASAALGEARTLGGCEFDVDAAIGKAEFEKAAKSKLVAAGELAEAGAHRRAMELLSTVPEGSELHAEARLQANESRAAEVRRLADDALSALQRGALSEAEAATEDLALLDAHNPVVAVLRGRLLEARRRPELPKARTTAAVPAISVTPKQKTQAERNAAGESAAAAGIDFVKRNELAAAIARLRAGLAAGPDAEIQGRLYRTLGIVYVRQEDSANALSAYEAYLEKSPNTPERERVQKIIEELRTKVR